MTGGIGGRTFLSVRGSIFHTACSLFQVVTRPYIGFSRSHVANAPDTLVSFSIAAPPLTYSTYSSPLIGDASLVAVLVRYEGVRAAATAGHDGMKPPPLFSTGTR